MFYTIRVFCSTTESCKQHVELEHHYFNVLMDLIKLYAAALLNFSLPSVGLLFVLYLTFSFPKTRLLYKYNYTWKVLKATKLFQYFKIKKIQFFKKKFVNFNRFEILMQNFNKLSIVITEIS